MHEFFITSVIGILLIGISSLSIYEILRFVWQRLPKLSMRPHCRVLLVVAAVFTGHILNIWVFGTIYYALVSAGMGDLMVTTAAHDDHIKDFFGCLYFSSVSYTTLGLGDVTPKGALRMIAGVESLAGFILIGWTVTFTYLAMEKFWELPHKRFK